MTIGGTCNFTFTPPTPPTFRQVDVGTCELDHLGKTAYEGFLIVNFAAGTQIGERTLTAANGDILRLTSAGTSRFVAPRVIGFSATLTIVSGTGRFANATGELSGVGLAVQATRTSTVSFTGTISYDASDRRKAH